MVRSHASLHAALGAVALATTVACADPAAKTDTPPRSAADATHSSADSAHPTNAAADASPPKVTRLDFDDVPIGTLPKDWKIDETNRDGPIAVWRVTPEGGAHSGRCMLLLAEKRTAADTTFNLCWNDRLRFGDGTIEVALQARTGKMDRGGGVMWRAKDARNYYVCRWNPLEKNVRAYVVKDSQHAQLASAPIDGDPRAWHTLRVEHVGAHVTCSFDSAKIFAFDDTSLPEAGGVGVWTKSDAASAFDDFVVTPR